MESYHLNPAGDVHVGFIATLMDTFAAFAIVLALDGRTRPNATVDMNMS